MLKGIGLQIQLDQTVLVHVAHMADAFFTKLDNDPDHVLEQVDIEPAILERDGLEQDGFEQDDCELDGSTDDNLEQHEDSSLTDVDTIV